MSRLYFKLLLNNNCSIVKRFNTRCIYTAVSQPRGQQDEQASSGESSSSISKAMHSYMERAKEHSTFMKDQEEEFVLGKRHLANMMGKDPETFTQNDINEAIRYLFPSGLYNIGARPVMKPPSEIYPKQKAAQFDLSGRPHHPFFYTTRPNFYFTTHELMNRLNKLNKMYRPEGAEPQGESIGYIKGTKWISQETLEQRLLEKLSENLYNEWVKAMDRLVNHASFEKELEFIKEYREPLLVAARENAPVVEIRPDGRKSVTIRDIRRKKSRAVVTVSMPGTGKVQVNTVQGEHDMRYFKEVQSRIQVIAPLQLANLLGKVDIEIEYEQQKHPRGESNDAFMARHGIAVGIVALGAEEEPLRIAGYLTSDRRQKERKKPGRTGARAVWTWKKR